MISAFCYTIRSSCVTMCGLLLCCSARFRSYIIIFYCFTICDFILVLHYLIALLWYSVWVHCSTAICDFVIVLERNVLFLVLQQEISLLCYNMSFCCCVAMRFFFFLVIICDFAVALRHVMLFLSCITWLGSWVTICNFLLPYIHFYI